MRIHVAIASLILLAGCATGRDELIVPVDVASAAGTPAAGAAAKVDVTDARSIIRMERTTVGAVSMGRIVLRPPEADLVRAVVSARLQAALARGAAAPDAVACAIRTFDIVTPATALYWDVTTTVQLAVRVRGAERVVAGTATERTYAWPSEDLIARVTTGALRQAAAELDKAFAELLSGAR
jgi:electron transfer flavoprotein alpha/beta subunit